MSTYSTELVWEETCLTSCSLLLGKRRSIACMGVRARSNPSTWCWLNVAIRTFGLLVMWPDVGSKAPDIRPSSVDFPMPTNRWSQLSALKWYWKAASRTQGESSCICLGKGIGSIRIVCSIAAKRCFLSKELCSLQNFPLNNLKLAPKKSKRLCLQEAVSVSETQLLAYHLLRPLQVCFPCPSRSPACWTAVDLQGSWSRHPGSWPSAQGHAGGLETYNQLQLITLGLSKNRKIVFKQCHHRTSTFLPVQQLLEAQTC